MQKLLPKILIAELILAIILVLTPLFYKSNPKVLSDKIIAQIDSTPIDTSGQTDNPTDTPTDSPVAPSSPSDTPSPTDTPTNTTLPSDQNTTASNPVPTDKPSETNAPAEQQTLPSPSTTTSDNQVVQDTQQLDISNANTTDLETQQLATSAVLKPVEEITSFNNISEQAITDAQTEDQQLNQTQSPASQQQLLVQFADDRITNIDSSTQNGDLATISFNTQRLANQLDKLTNITSTQLTGSQQQAANADLQALCSKANATLRSVQETVPDQLESDMETIRGKCLVQFGYSLDQ